MKATLFSAFTFLLIPLMTLSRIDAQQVDTGTVFSTKKGVTFAFYDGHYDWLFPAIDQLGCSWYYNWRPTPELNHPKVTAEFVPMIWGDADCTDENFHKVETSDSKTLLGFNEPDRKDQSDMSVEQALELWPKLMKTGLRLGSPAPGNASPSSPDLWLPKFMREAAKRHYRVDFICLHWYGDVTDPRAVDNLRRVLIENWRQYQKPIWLTEFSGSSGSWLKLHSPPITTGKNAEFVRKVIPMLESLPFVERYSWFELRWDEKPWATVALVDSRTGLPTVTGEAYRTAQ